MWEPTIYFLKERALALKGGGKVSAQAELDRGWNAPLDVAQFLKPQNGSLVFFPKLIISFNFISRGKLEE